MQGLERRHRLTQKTDFDRVLRGRSRSIRAGPFRLVAAPSTSPSARLGIVVPKRHLRLAVRRNRVKRVIRESFRRVRDTLPPVDVVVMLVGQPGDADFGRCLDQAWSKLGADGAWDLQRRGGDD